MAESNSYLNIVLQLKDDATQQLKGFQGALKNLEPQFKAIAVAGAAGFAAVSGVVYESLKAADEAAKVQAQLGAVLKSTGGIAGVTAKQALDLSSALQKTTIFGDEAILSAENLLLTFTKIGKDIFPDVTQTALDMSTALGQDLQSSATQLGKALQDPIEGVSALRRVGVNFNQTQQDTIKGMVEAGNLMGAQKFILAELATEFGGSAAAAAGTFGGQMAQLKNQMGEVSEEIGNALAPVLLELIKTIRPIVDRMVEWAKENPELVKQIIFVTAAVSGFLLVLGTLGLVLPAIIAGFAFLISPIGLVVIAVAALIAVGVLLYENWEFVKDNFVAVWEILKFNTQFAVNLIANFIKEKWTALRDWIKAIWDSVAETTRNVWNGIVDFFVGTWDSIKSTFKGAYDYIMNLIQPLLNAVNAVSGAVKGVVGSAGNIISSAAGKIGSVIGVKDAIISPGGQVIQTDPADWLIATKNPGALGGGGGVTVNVFGDVSGSELVEKVRTELMRELRLDTRFSV